MSKDIEYETTLKENEIMRNIILENFLQEAKFLYHNIDIVECLKNHGINLVDNYDKQIINLQSQLDQQKSMWKKLKEWLDRTLQLYLNECDIQSINLISDIINKMQELEKGEKDGTKGYSPENCRWTSYEKQNINRSDNIYLEYNGEKRTLNCWCKILNLPYPKMYYRIHFKKMTLEEAMKGVNFTFSNKPTATSYKYIYKQKDNYIIQIKRKYYGRTKILDNAINLRNSILKKMGILEQIQDIENYKGK